MTYFFSLSVRFLPKNSCLQNAMGDCPTGKYEKIRLLGKGTFGEAWLVNSKVVHCKSCIILVPTIGHGSGTDLFSLFGTGLKSKSLNYFFSTWNKTENLIEISSSATVKTSVIFGFGRIWNLFLVKNRNYLFLIRL